MSTLHAQVEPSGGSANPRRRAGSVGRRTIERVTLSGDGFQRRRVRDALASEEPLEVVVATPEGAQPIGVTMRTPGADFDLVAGFLFSEGIIDRASDLLAMRYCPGRAPNGGAKGGGGGAQLYNRVEVRLAGGAGAALDRARRRVTSSSCGVCGMDSIDAVVALGCPTVGAAVSVTAEVLLSLPGTLRAAQSLFERTGGLHAAALFDVEGRLLCIREDVGRHNAMDKLVGASLLAGELPFGGKLLLLSGRLSFELVQKAARGGGAVLAGVSAPSTLAVELAERTGITLVGFLRQTGFNVYAGGGRIELPVGSAAGPERGRS